MNLLQSLKELLGLYEFVGSGIGVTTHYYPITLPILKEYPERITAIWVVWVVSLYLLRFNKTKRQKVCFIKGFKNI